MTLGSYTEDTLVQQTTADYLEQQLGWESVYAYNSEDFGPNSLLGRSSDREVVLTRILRQKLAELNPGLPLQHTTTLCARSPPPWLRKPWLPPTGRSTTRCGTECRWHSATMKASW